MRLLHFGERGEDERKFSSPLFFAVLFLFSCLFSFFYHGVFADTSTTDISAPTEPGNLTATMQSLIKVDLTWGASTDPVNSAGQASGVAGYEVFKNGTSLFTVSGTSVSVMNGIVPGVNYEFKVQAIDVAGNKSVFSNFAFVSIPGDVEAPTVPTPFISRVSSSQIEIEWSASVDNVGVVKYEVYNGSTLSGAAYSGATHFLVTGLYPRTDYSFTVKAVDSSGNKSTSSGIISTTTLPVIVAPNPPTGLTAKTISASRIDLSWVSPGNAQNLSGYKIYMDGKYAFFSENNIFSCTGLTGGTKYSFHVTSYGLSGDESYRSETVTATTTYDTTPPSVPTGLTGYAASFSKIDLYWSASNDNTGVAGYKVYKDGVFIESVSGTSISLGGLTEGTGYSFTVRAFDGAGNMSDNTAQVFVQTPREGDTIAPLVPTGLSATAVSSSKIALSWKASTDPSNSSGQATGIRGYNIFRNSVFLASVSGTSYSDTGRAAEKTYTYQVSAYDASGNVSERSVAVSASTLPLPTGLPVVFSVHVGKAFCKSDGTTYAPVTFATEPAGMGSFKVSGSVLSSQTFGNKTYELKNGSYTWEGVPAMRYIASGASRGSFVISFLVCSTKPSVVETPKPTPVVAPSPTESPNIGGDGSSDAEASDKTLEVFSTYSETEKAMIKEAAGTIPASSTVLRTTEIMQVIRSGYALPPESLTVTIGEKVYSRADDAALIEGTVEKLLSDRPTGTLLSDTDSDGVSDYDEKYLYGTDQKKSDTDGDGISDKEEILAGMNPVKKVISPIAYENPKTNTVFASTSPDAFVMDKIEAILSPQIGEDREKVVGIVLFGKALSNSFITLYIFSTPIVVTVQTDNDGRWTYTIDKELENGKHNLYLAVTESSGKIIAKSNPIPFVKTADAVSLGAFLPVAEASVPKKQGGFFGGNSLYISLGVIAFAVVAGIIALSITLKKRNSDAESEENNQ